jgi:hypothetical protein
VLKVLTFLSCLFRGHEWHVSRSRPGRLTCIKCRARKRIP